MPPTPPPADPADPPGRSIGPREVALGRRIAERLRRGARAGERLEEGPARVAVHGRGWWIEILCFSTGPTVTYAGALDVYAASLLVVAASEASHD